MLVSNHRRPAEWDGTWWGVAPARRARPARSVEWEGTPIVVETVRGRLADASADVRRAALEGVIAMREKTLLEDVRARFEVEEDEALKLQVLDVCAKLQDQDAAPLIRTLLRERGVGPALRARAARAAAEIGGETLTVMLADLALANASDSTLVALCLESLSRAGGEDADACCSTRASPSSASRACARSASAASSASGSRTTPSCVWPRPTPTPRCDGWPSPRSDGARVPTRSTS